jgi:hypothetical protein
MGHGAANHEMAEAHSESTNNQQRAPAGLVDKQPHDAGKEDEHGILDSGRHRRSG